MRFLAITATILGTFVALTAADPPKNALIPTEFSWNKSGKVLGEVADALPRTTGVEVTVAPAALKTQCAVRFDKAPLWEALQTIADATNTRLALGGGGSRVELVPRGRSLEVATTSGAFRVVAQQVAGRAMLEQGTTFHEVQLLVHWEPRLRVYRIDSAPKISKVTDVPSSKITADGGSAQILPVNATTEMKVRLNGLTRKSEKITSLAGEFNVTAAERILSFAFEAPDGKLPDKQKQGEVSTLLKRLQQKDNMWEVVLEVSYPKGQPVFESFQGEWWLRDNRLVLRSPEGKAVVINDYEIPQPDRTTPLVVIHRFKEDAKNGFGNPTAKGWSLIYETPSPLVDVNVPFELKGIPLP